MPIVGEIVPFVREPDRPAGATTAAPNDHGRSRSQRPPPAALWTSIGLATEPPGHPRGLALG
jgi:hypothetical protein